MTNVGGSASAPLSAEALIPRATANTGLDDFGGTDFVGPLNLLCDDVNALDHISPLGRMMAEANLLTPLENRLRVVDRVRSSPDLDHVEVQDPIIIIGMPRTGKTSVHRMMTRVQGSTFLPAWQEKSFVPPVGPDERREQTAMERGYFANISPRHAALHPLELDEAEECWTLIAPSFKTSAVASTTFTAPGYLRWLETQDPETGYDLYADGVRILQADRPGRRLVLNSPFHTGRLPAIAAVLPSIRFVQTHRDPAKVIVDWLNMREILHEASGIEVDRAETAQHQLRWWSHAIGLNDAQRDAHAFEVVDVSFSRHVRDPSGTMRDIHERFSLPYTAADDERVRERAAAASKRYPSSDHPLRLEDFGLTAGDVRAAFSDYIDRYEIEPEI